VQNGVFDAFDGDSARQKNPFISMQTQKPRAIPHLGDGKAALSKIPPPPANNGSAHRDSSQTRKILAVRPTKKASESGTTILPRGECTRFQPSAA
jgi:hypothetical protein